MTAEPLETFGIPIKCGCSRAAKVRNLHAVQANIVRVLKRCGPLPPDLVLLSWRCWHCKQIVAITAKMLRLNTEHLREIA